MGLTIGDGTGSGSEAEVDKHNRLASAATSINEQHFYNRQKRYWVMPFDAVDPTDADDYFLVVKYTGTGLLVLTDVRITSTVAGFLELQKVTGTAVNGSPVGLVNRYLGATETPEGTYEVGVNITGLVDDGHLAHQWLQADTQGQIKMDGKILIPPGQSLALLWTVSTGVLSGGVSIYEIL